MSRVRNHYRRQARQARGNTLVLVTAILVLLVIIATAYISRAQGGRVIAAAQRKAIDREDRSHLVAGVISRDIAKGLFPALVDQSDPGLNSLSGVASSAGPRLQVNEWSINYGIDLDGNGSPDQIPVDIARYGVDPQGQVDANGVFRPFFPYNHAPYATRAWTNWPDSGLNDIQIAFPFGAGAPAGGLLPGDDNPIGNPGFGDSRWLRSSEPERRYDGGVATGFTHWRHLSWPASAENGWRVCPDISDIDANTITATASTQLGPGQDYLDLGVPVALQTPYEQWLPFLIPAGFDTAEEFSERRNAWFSPPADYFRALTNPQQALPNFLRLNDYGPRQDAFSQLALNVRPPRAEIERTLTDTDGDGFTDSFWFVVPGTSEDGVRQVVGVSVVDNGSRVDLQTATRFDRWSTAGHTPADVALASRLVLPGEIGSGSLNPEMDENDTMVGLFADPQNIWPAIPTSSHGDLTGHASNWNFDYLQGETFFPFRYGRLDTSGVQTGWDPRLFGDTGSSDINSPTWLRQTGVLALEEANFEAPFQSVLVAAPGISTRSQARADRVRYFNRRQDGGGFFARIDFGNAGNPNDDSLAVGLAPTRGFASADELELRMFEASNYGPVVSSLERTINRPFSLGTNIFRSTLQRSESVENYLGVEDRDDIDDWREGTPPGRKNPFVGPTYGLINGDPRSGDQLDASELLRDVRHRSTTISGTRNDLRPLSLTPSPYFNPFLPRLAFGRLADSAAPFDIKLEMARADYEASRRKLDLRGALDARVTDYETRLYAGDSNDPNDAFFRGPFRIGGLGLGEYYSPETLGPGLGRTLELDRAFRFRWSLQDLLDQSMAGFTDAGTDRYHQSYFGSNFQNEPFNLLAYQKSKLAAASWAANIDSMRDRRLRPVIAHDYTAGTPAEGTILVDAPIYPEFAPRLSPQDNAGMPNDLRNLVFPGLEKQPFIMESYFSMVYPRGKMTDEDVDKLKDDGYEQFCETNNLPAPQFDSDTWRSKIPPGFDGSGEHWVDRRKKPAVIFAVQLANPFDAPVPLHDIFIRIGETGREGSTNNETITRTLNFGKLPSPHPRIKADGRSFPFYTPDELYLGPTKPDAPRTAIVFGVIPPAEIDDLGSEFESEFGIPYSEFHAKWRDFLDIEPGALFGWDPSLEPFRHETIVVDASPKTYILTSPETGDEFTPPIQPLLNLDADDWFTNLDQSVELYRYTLNPNTYDPNVAPFQNEGRLYCIDRLDNDQTGDEIDFKDDMEALGESPDFQPPEPGFVFERLNPGRNKWAGIRLASDDAFVNYVRAARAWGWDANRNGIYDMSENNPRFVYSILPGDDFSQNSETALEESGVEREVKGRAILWSDDPDGNSPGGRPWIVRNYLSPLALNFNAAAGPFVADFFVIRGKPVNLSTATAVIGTPGVQPVSVDYDAGFPVVNDGGFRENSLAPWPGRPAALVQNWILMDKGQKPEELANGSRGNQGAENYDRIWLERECWAMPLQMLQKDDDIEQVGEVLNAFIWGHAVNGVQDQILSIRGFETVSTFSEIMASNRSDDLFPVRLNDENDTKGYPEVRNARINRYRADPGALTDPVNGAVNAFRPNTQVLEVAAVGAPWTPKLPAGLGFLDGLVCDGPGSNYRLDVFNDAVDPADVLYEKDQRFGNAAGFSGQGTPGLINLNTASPEVMRTLPHMSRLVINDFYDEFNTAELWTRTVRANGITKGDVNSSLANGRMLPKTTANRNSNFIRVPESIARYRDGATWATRLNEFTTPEITQADDRWFLPFFLDRGTFSEGNASQSMADWVPQYPELNGNVGYFPGMRRTSGIESIGELLLVDRGGNPVNDQVRDTWLGASSGISAAAGNFGSLSGQLGLETFDGEFNVGQAGVPAAFDLLRLGWSEGLQLDARLSVDRQPVQWTMYEEGDPGTPQVQELPDVVAGDAEEVNMLFAGISNLVSVRSDTFSVHLKIRSFKQNPVSGVWNATDPAFIVDDSRYLMVVDRSRCDRPGDEPEIKLFSKLPN